ncbi:MAG: MMPL family transporter [Candidatus Thiodiazotropha sp. (ex. Lucinoma kazani)]
MKPRLAIATTLMIIVWAVMATHFQPSSIPTIEQLLPPESIAQTREIRSLFSETSQHVLLYLPTEMENTSTATLLKELHSSISGLHSLCLFSSRMSETSTADLLPFTLLPCSKKESISSQPDLILFWRITSRQLAVDTPSLRKRIEDNLKSALSPPFVKKSHLYAPEIISEASWEAALSDLRWIAPLLGLIVFVVPLFAFRSLTAPAFIFLTAGLTTTTTLLLFNGNLHGGFNALLLAVVPLLWAVASMDAAHLVERVQSNQIRGLPKPFYRAIRDLAGPCTVTTVTTAIGFAALALQGDAPLLRTFGLTAAAGTLLAIIFTTLLGWLFLNSGITRKTALSSINPLADLSHSLVQTSIRYPVLTLIIWGLLLISLIPLVSRVTTHTPFPHIFSQDHPLTAKTAKLQQLLGTDLRPLTIYLVADKESGLNKQRLLHATAATVDYLAKLPETRLILPVALISQTCDIACLENTISTTDLLWFHEKRGIARLEIHFAVASAQRQQEIQTWLEKFDQTMLGHHRLIFDGPGYHYPTVEALGISGAFTGIIWSLAGILFSLLVVFRRLRVVLPALLVTLLPLWLIIGLMGAAEIDWSLALLGVPAMLFGLAVDDTIHLLWSQTPNASVNRTLRYNALRSGAALTATTLMLFLSVLTLALSGLQANREIALLLSAGMALALAMDLTLLPASVSLMRHRSPQSKQ